jgi:hypothetical protein
VDIEEVFYRHVLQYLGVRVFLIRLLNYILVYITVAFCNWSAGVTRMQRRVSNQGAKIYGNFGACSGPKSGPVFMYVGYGHLIQVLFSDTMSREVYCRSLNFLPRHM